MNNFWKYLLLINKIEFFILEILTISTQNCKLSMCMIEHNDGKMQVLDTSSLCKTTNISIVILFPVTFSRNPIKKIIICRKLIYWLLYLSYLTCLFYTIQLIYVVNIVLDLTRWRSISNTILFQLYVSWMTTTLIIDLIRIFSYILKRTSLSFEFYLMYFMFIYCLFILRLFRWSSFYHDSVELILILKQIMLLPGQEYDRCYQVILCVWV